MQASDCIFRAQEGTDFCQDDSPSENLGVEGLTGRLVFITGSTRNTTFLNCQYPRSGGRFRPDIVRMLSTYFCMLMALQFVRYFVISPGKVVGMSCISTSEQSTVSPVMAICNCPAGTT